MPDFSSQAYWAPRLARELGTGGFEWLASTDAVDFAERVVADVVGAPSSDGRPVRVLHFGAGSSMLGPELAERLAARGLSGEIVDADYVDLGSAPVCNGAVAHRRAILDVLDAAAVDAATADGPFDVVIDKSTADAISCGPDVRGTDGVREPLEVLMENLAAATRRGARWACVSYSASRFDGIVGATGGEGAAGAGGRLQAESAASGRAGPEVCDAASVTPAWAVVSKTLLARVSGQPREVGGRVVYEPETGVWGWVLERV